MILIVDPDKDTVEFFSEMLKKNGYEVSACHDGNSALKQALKIKPRLVILDYNLPDLPGTEVITKLRETNHNLKAIMVPSVPHPEIAKKTNEVEGCAYLPKPFDLGELLILVKKAMK